MNNTEKTYDPELVNQFGNKLNESIAELLITEMEGLPELFEKLTPADRVNATLRLLEIVFNTEE